mgnify:CR=1 FL=1
MTMAMDCVITLAAPGPLDPFRVAAVTEAVGGTFVERLSDTAQDIYAAGDPRALRDAALTVLADDPVDVIAQPVASRAKKLLISDMDSTLIQQECIDELGAMVGKKAEIAAITERAMAGELDFAEALRARVALLQGVPTSAVADLLADVIVDTPGAREVIAACRAAGIRTVLVSGGFTAFAEPIRQRLGMDAAYSNILLTDGDVFSGAVADPILGADAKRVRMNAECSALNITASEVVAVGDGANDIPMIEGAGLGVGYRAKPKLAAAADAVLRHTDFSTVGYAMGLLRP